MAKYGDKYCNLSIDGQKLMRFMTTVDAVVVYANKNTSVPKYLLNFKDHTCSCPSFRYKNFKKNTDTCKHLLKYEKINQALIMIEMIRKEHLHNVLLPMKDILQIILS